MTDTAATDQTPASKRPAGAPGAPLKALREAVLAAATEAGGAAAATSGSRRGAVTLERPKQTKFGDYSTNAALLIAPGTGMAPQTVADRLGKGLKERLGTSLERYEVAGPGFLNLFLADTWLQGALSDVLSSGPGFGGGSASPPERVLVEFVSANPTGPMHVGHARNAAYGDSLARMLAFHGHRVEREFYINDAGSQIHRFGESIRALARGEQVADDGYKGAYVVKLMESLTGPAEMNPDELGAEAVRRMIEDMRDSLRAFRVEPFDNWQSEGHLHRGEPSLVERSLAVLKEQGHTYEQDGALWLRTTDFGDDKDRVLVRSSGEHTYFASDIAYHQDKRERGYQRQIDVWGADHHGYVLRMKAAYEALGGDPDELELLIMQLVHLVRAGARAQMSKRAGEFVTLDELVEEIGVDAARWYLLSRSHDTTLDLDLDLARSQSSENPVYYVQYAHARIASMLDRAGEDPGRADKWAIEDGYPEPLHESERALVLLLLSFPEELAEAVDRRAPHRLAAHVLELAQGFTAFYRDCRVVGVEPESVESFRVALCVASMRTIARCLELLGVSAPKRM